MGKPEALQGNESDILVVASPIDLNATTQDFDSVARAEARARIAANAKRNDGTQVETRRSFGKTFDEQRYSIRNYVPESEGTGYWDMYRISAQVLIMIAECEYRRPKWLNVPGEECFKIRYLQSGALVDKRGNEFLEPSRAMYEVYPSTAGDGYFIPANTSCRLAIIHCSRDVLTTQLGMTTEEVPEPLRGLAKGDKSDPHSHLFDPTPPMSLAFKDLLEGRDLFESNLRVWYVEAKAKEIIASLIQMMKLEPDLHVGANRISRRDRQRVLEAREIVLAHIDDVPTIPELARLVGINQTKLKAAFKKIFGTTIGRFVTEQQMNLAARMLTATDLDVSQIGLTLGYSHSGNFTQAFKRHFGRVPRDYRREASVVEQSSLGEM